MQNSEILHTLILCAFSPSQVLKYILSKENMIAKFQKLWKFEKAEEETHWVSTML